MKKEILSKLCILTTVSAITLTCSVCDIFAKEDTLTFTDDLGRQVTVESSDRVVVLTSSFADIWATAGGVDNIVGIVGTIFQELVGFDIQDVVHALLNKITCESCGIAKHHKWHLCLDIDITVEASSKGI